MRKAKAADSITEWAYKAFYDGRNDIVPDVEVLSLQYDRDEDLWEAELFVSTSVDNPFVTFWFDQHHFFSENRLHIESVEY